MTLHAPPPSTKVLPLGAPPGTAGGREPAERPGRGRLMRRVELACLLADGSVMEAARLVPALPAFEEPFAAFARGTLFPTDRGPVAIEDLRPGARLRVADGSLRTLLWHGSTMIVPMAGGLLGNGPATERDSAKDPAQDPAQDPAMTRLTRVAADALGPGRPSHDLVLGPFARVVCRVPGHRPDGGAAALVLASDLVDGEGVVATVPPAPVQVFHLGFERHERLRAQGVEVESHHPGPAPALPPRADLLDLWLSCFPHKADLAAFGPLALPRLSRPA